MRRRNYEFEIIEIILAVIIIVLTVVLFFRSAELTILFPVVFALACVLTILYAFEGILYNRNRVVKKSRLIVYGFLALVLGFITYVSIRTVM